MGAVGRKVEAEDFEGDETTGRGVEGLKSRAKRSCANRKRYAIRTDGVRRRRADSIRMQCVVSSKEGGRW